VAFEGVDGCGKSTQVQRCAAWLTARRPGRATRVVREPGGTELGEAVRGLLLDGGGMTPMAEMLLYMASRAELYARVVLPALGRGEAVLLDRSQYSTAAYQGDGLGLDPAAILSLAQQAVGGRLPDRVVLLDLPPERARARVLPGDGGGRDRIERRDPVYFARVAAAYRRLAAAEPERFRVLDASADADTVERAVRDALADVA
jgi:dTMP kinase